eukprot:SAG31_NODE_4483_length_3196_cov_36.451082_4_plen_44_part_00
MELERAGMMDCLLHTRNPEVRHHTDRATRHSVLKDRLLRLVKH